MNSSNPLKMSILGYGGMAGYHFSRLSKLGLVKFVGAFDTDEKRMQAAAKDGMTAYPSAEALFADPQTEAVLIATPNDWHRPYAVAAANAGKHVICEKPVALSCEELDEMTAAAIKNKVVLEVHQNRRWDADYIAVQNIINGGKLGKIYRIDSHVCGANGIPGGWRKLPEQGGGMMLDWGVHLLDQIFDFIKEKPLSLYCKYSHALGFDVDDGFDAQIGFENDLTVNVRVDTNTFTPMPRWIIYGRDGTAVINDWDLNGKIVLPVYGKEVEIVGIKAGNGFTKTMAYRPHDSVSESDIPAPSVDGDAFYKNFVAAVRGKEKPIVSNESVRKILRIMELCAISSKENKVIKDELKNL